MKFECCFFRFHIFNNFYIGQKFSVFYLQIWGRSEVIQTMLGRILSFYKSTKLQKLLRNLLCNSTLLCLVLLPNLNNSKRVWNLILMKKDMTLDTFDINNILSLVLLASSFKSAWACVVIPKRYDTWYFGIFTLAWSIEPKSCDVKVKKKERKT